MLEVTEKSQVEYIGLIGTNLENCSFNSSIFTSIDDFVEAMKAKLEKQTPENTTLSKLGKYMLAENFTLYWKNFLHNDILLSGVVIWKFMFLDFVDNQRMVWQMIDDLFIILSILERFRPRLFSKHTDNSCIVPKRCLNGIRAFLLACDRANMKSLLPICLQRDLIEAVYPIVIRAQKGTKFHENSLDIMLGCPRGFDIVCLNKA